MNIGWNGWNTHTLPYFDISFHSRRRLFIATDRQVFGEAEVLGVSKVGFRNRALELPSGYD